EAPRRVHRVPAAGRLSTGGGYLPARSAVPTRASVADPELYCLHDEKDDRQYQVEAEDPHRQGAPARPHGPFEEGELRHPPGFTPHSGLAFGRRGDFG